MRSFKSLIVCCLLLPALNALAGASKMPWHTFPVFNEAPLEIKLGTFSDGPNPDLLAAVLWNDGSNNRLDAVRIPAPYDGTGVTSTSLENTATLFALGDICRVGNIVLVPYIKNFNLEVSRFDGVDWTQSTVPGTTTNNFDNADCAQTLDGVFLGTHDLTDGETEIFRSTNAGSSYTFYGRYSSVGPFGGGIREPLASSFGDRYLMGINQLSNGQIRVSHSSTTNATPSFNHTPIENLPPPTGFTFVKEGAAAFNGHGITFTYNSNGTARTVEFPESGPFSVVERDLGPISNSGSQFTFQGGTIVNFFDLEDQPVVTKAVWGGYWFFDSYDPTSVLQSDPTYPLAGIGGPVDGCRITMEGDYTHETHLLLGGPRVGSDGTDLRMRQVVVDAISHDGFETPDSVSAFATCP